MPTEITEREIYNFISPLSVISVDFVVEKNNLFIILFSKNSLLSEVLLV